MAIALPSIMVISAHAGYALFCPDLMSASMPEIKIDMDELDLAADESKAKYAQIREYVLSKFGFKVPTLYIAQIKRECGLELRGNYSKSKKSRPSFILCKPAGLS